MKPTLWDKGGVGPDALVQQFLAGEDVLWDRHLFLHDIRASKAHVHGLMRIGILTAAESAALERELDALSTEFKAGRFTLDERFEDGHSAIELVLTEKLGPLGQKVHTGRSRNDQVLVAQRLFLKDALASLQKVCAHAADAFLVRARSDAATPMPGYTHLQRAVPSTVGFWMAAYAKSLADVASLARSTRDWLDASPLGTAAGYGVNLPLDRAGVASELGFARVQLNPMYAQNSRGRFELQSLSALQQALLEVRRFAWDLSLFSTAEFGFVSLPPGYTTGSSIMPNKRNPDVVELMRASPAVVTGAMTELQEVLALPGAYHRDLQATKAPTLRAWEHGLRVLNLVTPLVNALSFNRERMRASISADMYATDRAVELASQGVPFREAYQQVARELPTLQARTPEQSNAARTSPGAPGALFLDEIALRIAAALSA